MNVEINLIGTGGGYGESVLIRLSNGDWVIVDSCIDPISKCILPLKFLEEREVDLLLVKIIVCTHWHDDHIRGLSSILANCFNAKFVFSKVNDLEKFLLYISLDYSKALIQTSNASTVEFNKCLDILSSTKRFPVYATRDVLLYGDNGSKTYLYALSPSAKSEMEFDIEIGTLLKDFGSPHTKLPKNSPNDRSIVLLLKVDNESMIFGADLEVNKDPLKGWFDIIQNSVIIQISNKASYFKIPHHGSQNGYCNEIWENLLIKKPVSTLTPWNRKSKLPQENMVNLYKSLTEHLFITSNYLMGDRMKRRDKKTEKLIKEFNPTVKEIKFEFGLVTSKIDLRNEAIWDTTTMGEAKKII